MTEMTEMNDMTICSILKKYKMNYDISNIDTIQYSYDIAKYNTHKKNIEIINDYINHGDYIEIEFLQEKYRNSKRIRQIAAILLERYLNST